MASPLIARGGRDGFTAAVLVLPRTAAEAPLQNRKAILSSFHIEQSPCIGASDMNVLGVILARAGSVGLKDKHLLNLLGRPVIEYTFGHAQVVVSSDCPRIRLLAERRGLFQDCDD